MQYHLIVMMLAEKSSSYSLFACHTMLTTSILTLLKLSNISKPLCSLLTLAPEYPATTTKRCSVWTGHVDCGKDTLML